MDIQLFLYLAVFNAPARLTPAAQDLGSLLRTCEVSIAPFSGLKDNTSIGLLSTRV